MEKMINPTFIINARQLFIV